jgi:hypothetical protein
MARRRLLSSGEIFALHAPKFAEIDLIPVGFIGGRYNRNGFYLRPARAGKAIEVTRWMAAEDGPPAWPYVDVIVAGVKGEFIYDGSTETRSPNEWQRDHFFAAIKDQLFPARAFKLRTPGSPTLNEFRLSVIVEGPPIPGWHDAGEVWANATAFLPYRTPEYNAYDAALRYEYARRNAQATRHKPNPAEVAAAELAAAREAQAALAAT